MQSWMSRSGRRRATLLAGLKLLVALGLLTTQAALVHAQSGGAQSGNAQTSDWPVKPLRIVPPFPPGGPADVQGRALAAATTLDRAWDFATRFDDVRMKRSNPVGSVAPMRSARRRVERARPRARR